MLKGSYVALVTPFKKNEIDYNAVESLLNFHLENETDGLLLCGTTGESPTLAGDEKEQLLRFSLQKINHRLPVMMGTGTNNLSHTISATFRAQELGADYALVITPYYNKPTQQGLYQFFREVSVNTDIPLVIYNVPGRTGVNIASSTVLKLAHEFPGIIGIKEASGNLIQLSEIIRDAPDGFAVLSGEDALNYPILCCGGQGVISVTANLKPRLLHEMVEACQQGNYTKAREIHLHLLELNRILFIETNPIPVKSALAEMGMISPEIRLPLCQPESANLEKLRAVLHNYKLI